MKLTKLFILLLSCGAFTAFASPVDSLKNLEDFLEHHEIEAKESNGLYYSIEKEGSGDLPKPGDYLKL